VKKPSLLASFISKPSVAVPAQVVTPMVIQQDNSNTPITIEKYSKKF